MSTTLNFEIISSDPISKLFLEHNIYDFKEATKFVRELPYGRNKNKTDLTTVFYDNCGTCSTKHALLKQLADENNFNEFKLLIGLFKMNSINTPKISNTLKQYNLEYIPEAHNYLKFSNQILDYTTKSSKAEDFESDLIEEIEIQPNQISDFKIKYHKHFLSKWLDTKKSINLTLDELWKIREQCILDLSTK